MRQELKSQSFFFFFHQIRNQKVNRRKGCKAAIAKNDIFIYYMVSLSFSFFFNYLALFFIENNYTIFPIQAKLFDEINFK
jgi:hypothetical protein